MKHKYKVLLTSSIICGIILIPLYILMLTSDSQDMFFYIYLRSALTITLAFIVLIIYMVRHKELMKAEFKKTAVTMPTYMERRAVEAPEMFKASLEGRHTCADGSALSIDGDEYTIPLQYLYRLFIIDSESWNYTTYVALDIRDGKPYRVTKKTTRQLNIYGADLHTKPIDYDEVRRLAVRGRKNADFSQLSDDNWESFIPEDKRFTGEEKLDNRVDISAADGKADKKLTAFFYESRVDRKSHIVAYLRETDKGFRLFGAQALDGVIGLRFEFDCTEQMVRDVFDQKYGNMLYAADRMLSDKEAEFVQTLFADNSDEACRNADNVICCAVADGKYDDSKTAARQNLAETLVSLALYGSK